MSAYILCHAMPCYSSYPSNSSSNITIHSNYLDYSCNRKLPQYSPLYCTSHRDHLTPSATSFLVLAFGQKAGTSPCDEAHVPFTPLLFFALSTTPSLFSPLFSFFVLHTGVYAWVCSHEGAQRNGMDHPSPPFLLVPSSQEKRGPTDPRMRLTWPLSPSSLAKHTSHIHHHFSSFPFFSFFRTDRVLRAHLTTKKTSWVGGLFI